MASEGRNRVSELHHRALERPPEERGAFLQEACDGDQALREDDVQSLLGCESASARFLEARRRSWQATLRAHQMTIR